MTTTIAPAPSPERRTRRKDRNQESASGRAATLLRWSGALGAAFLIFSILLLAKGVDPIEAYANMWVSTFTRPRSIQQVFIQMAPLALAALAVAVPAKAGLTNVGGEGQLIFGAVAACGVSLALDDNLPGGAVLSLMMVAAIIAGALWAGLAGLLRLYVDVNEAVSTLLLNFIALDLLLFLIYQPWRESRTSQPATRELADSAKLPVLSGTQVHIGILAAVIAAVAVYAALKYTRWGFLVSVAGGNSEAARRAGLPVSTLVLSALMIGGALAGLAGMIHFAGVEYKLRPGFGSQIGYTGFLACWLARHQPFPILVAAFVFASLSVAGDSLQLDAGLPAASISILTALILIAVLGWTTKRKASA